MTPAVNDEILPVLREAGQDDQGAPTMAHDVLDASDIPGFPRIKVVLAAVAQEELMRACRDKR